MKRESNHVSRNAHEAVNEIIINSSTNDMLANENFLLAKQILADLPVTPTADCVHSLLSAIQLGLLDVTDCKKSKEMWQNLVDSAYDYLVSINRISVI